MWASARPTPASRFPACAPAQKTSPTTRPAAAAACARRASAQVKSELIGQSNAQRCRPLRGNNAGVLLVLSTSQDPHPHCSLEPPQTCAMCPDVSECQDRGTCIPAIGVCGAATNKTDGADCTGGTCQSGVCTGADGHGWGGRRADLAHAWVGIGAALNARKLNCGGTALPEQRFHPVIHG